MPPARRPASSRRSSPPACAAIPGLAHRQELLAIIDGIGYVNDSKATNADAAAKALACYDPIYWIAGGRAKAGDLSAIEASFPRIAPRIAHAFLIGEAETDFAKALEGRVAATCCDDLATALGAARRQALADGRPGAVVLLSPAAASFDQYADFEARGEAFRGLVAALPGVRDEDALPGVPRAGGRLQ